jgi:Flp pilus assembly protein TadB
MRKNRAMPADPPRRRRTPGPPGTNIRADIAKTARLWGLSLVCATVGAYVVWRTDTLLPGIYAFLITLAVLGLALYAYERRRR